LSRFRFLVVLTPGIDEGKILRKSGNHFSDFLSTDRHRRQRERMVTSLLENEEVDPLEHKEIKL
jgi:hypothetical protein